MPQFLIDWYFAWLTFWNNHPVLFWSAVVCAVTFSVLTSRLRRRK